MRWFAYLIILVAAIVSGCYDDHSQPLAEPFAERANCTIAQLRDLCKGDNYALIEQDMVCVGRITSSDLDGNFYRSIVVEDDSGGCEVLLGGYNLATIFPEGLKIALRLKGCAIAIASGVVQVGLPSRYSSSKLCEIAPQAVIDQHLVRSSSILPIEPQSRSVALFEEADCGRFVRVDNLRYAPLSDEEEEYYHFVDGDSNSLFVYISSYANFADSELFDADYSVQGIVYYEQVSRDVGKQFVIKPRFGDDISIDSNNL